MKHLTQYITEYLIKKKVDKVRGGYKYTPKTKDELIDNIKELLDQGETNLNCIDTSNITDMSNLFSGIYYKSIKLKTNIDISGWNVSNVTSMRNMFYQCENFEGKGLENWDVSNVKDMCRIFSHCRKFDCDLSNWNVSNVENMYCMFTSCYSFKGIGLENWNVSNVENMSATFYNCKNFNSDLSNWDVSNVKDMDYVFKGCKNFTGKGIENWNVSQINKRDMFEGCYKIKKIPSWYYRSK